MVCVKWLHVQSYWNIHRQGYRGHNTIFYITFPKRNSFALTFESFKLEEHSDDLINWKDKSRNEFNFDKLQTGHPVGTLDHTLYNPNWIIRSRPRSRPRGGWHSSREPCFYFSSANQAKALKKKPWLSFLDLLNTHILEMFTPLFELVLWE